MSIYCSEAGEVERQCQFICLFCYILPSFPIISFVSLLPTALNIMVYRFVRRGSILYPPGSKKRVPSLRSFFDRTPPFIATLPPCARPLFLIPAVCGPPPQPLPTPYRLLTPYNPPPTQSRPSCHLPCCQPKQPLSRLSHWNYR